MGSAARLSHGGAELCGGALAARQGNGIGPAASPARQITREHDPEECSGFPSRQTRSVCAQIIINKKSEVSGCRRKRLACIGADALDHRAQTIGALRREVVAEAELVEYLERVGRENFLWRMA